MIINLPTKRRGLCHIRVTNILKSFTHKMAAETSWHRYGTKLRHCHRMYRRTYCGKVPGSRLGCVVWRGSWRAPACTTTSTCVRRSRRRLPCTAGAPRRMDDTRSARGRHDAVDTPSSADTSSTDTFLPGHTHTHTHTHTMSARSNTTDCDADGRRAQSVMSRSCCICRTAKPRRWCR